jgi:cephalosporin-C deacetylase-like acetyl esterase
MRTFAVSLAALVLLGAAPRPALPDFAYDPARTTCQAAAADADGIIPFTVGGPDVPTTHGVLVAPSNPAATGGGVLWVHWLGAVPTTNHTEFLVDARALATRGVRSLLLDMPWSQPDWFTKVRAPDHDYADTLRAVLILRRSLDCLAALPHIDTTRLAVVGHDFGAMTSALLLAVDPRPSFAVLMAPALTFWEWYLLAGPPPDQGAYVAQLSALDLPGWLSRGKQRGTLLQFAKNDQYVAESTGVAIYNATPNRDREIKVYDLGHDLDDEVTHEDRVAWLLVRVGG